MSEINFNKAKLCFENGVNYFKNYQYKKAEEEFFNSLEFLPDRLSVISNLIQIYINTENKAGLNNLLFKYKHLKKEKEIGLGFAYQEYFNNRNDDSINVCNNLLKYENDKDFQLKLFNLIAANNSRKKNFAESIKYFRKILLKDKTDSINYYNIGCLLLNLGKPRQAYIYLKRSNVLQPGNNLVLFHISLCLLTLRDLRNGFELYEKRWERNNAEPKKFSHVKTILKIDEIINKRILIWDEQGFGDTILFSRFLFDLLKHTKDITFVVHKSIKNLFVNLHKDIVVEDYNSVIVDNFDYQLSVCSIPLLLEINKPELITYRPLNLPKIDFEITNSLFLNNKLNIGFVWSGNSKFANDEYRSIPFEFFAPLLKVEKFNFFKLSKDLEIKDLFKFYSNNINNLGDKTFYELSYYLKRLDIIISCDSSIVHLCGILGVKCILLLNFNSDWRWFDNKHNTEWYPSVTIIKQKKFNDWGYVFEELNKRLEVIYKEKFYVN